MFESRALVQSWLDVERALAEAEAEVGVIPAAAAERIAAEADASLYDLAELREGIAASKHPLVPLIRALVGAMRRRGRLGALGCDDAGRRRHGARPPGALRARPDRARSRACRARCLRARPALPRDADGGEDALPARRADHVRAEGRHLGGRARPVPRGASTGAAGDRLDRAARRAPPARWPRSATRRKPCRRRSAAARPAPRRRPLARDARPAARPRARALRDRLGGRANRGGDRPAAVDGDRGGRRSRRPTRTSALRRCRRSAIR